VALKFGFQPPAFESLGQGGGYGVEKLLVGRVVVVAGAAGEREAAVKMIVKNERVVEVRAEAELTE